MNRSPRFLNPKYRRIAKYQAAKEDLLLAEPDVVGVAIGKKSRDGMAIDASQLELKVLYGGKQPLTGLVAEERRAFEQRIDGILGGGDFPYDVVETGRIQVRTPSPPVIFSSDPLIEWQRPAKGGYNISHISDAGGPGTLGILCRGNSAPGEGVPKFYILSNNHVMANNDPALLAPGNDAILQPSLYYGEGNQYNAPPPQDVIAHLSDFKTIEFHAGADEPCNFVDAAIAECVPEQDVVTGIYDIGELQGKNLTPEVDEPVYMTGYESGKQSGTITAVNATIEVEFLAQGKVATFCEQILTTKMSAPGDSGSLVVGEQNNEAIGLLFGGDLMEKLSYVNPIGYVEEELNISVFWQ